MYPSYCDRICDPGYNMADSCKRDCAGYVFTTTNLPSTSGSGASSQHGLSSSAKIIIIAVCSTFGFCLMLGMLACIFKKRIKRIWHQINLRFEKLPHEETGNGNTSLGTVTVVPGGRSMAPRFQSAEERHLITEEHHHSEQDALITNCPSAAPEDLKQNTTLPLEEQQELIDPDQPGSDQGIASLPYPSEFSNDREQSSGYLSMDDRINHEEQSLSKDEHITNENTVRKTMA